MAAQLETLHQQDEPPIVFVSYSREDKEWKDRLLPHLEQLRPLGILRVWDDGQIKTGVDWYARIKEILSKTRCAVCLITANFLNSSFCMNEEIPYLLQQRYRGKLELFPILLKDCFWEAHPWLKRWQIMPRGARPVLTHFRGDPDRVFANVARQVVKYLETGAGHERPVPVGPEPKNDIDRLPATDNLLFGRREDLNRLTRAWDEQQLNVVVLVASGGAGKSTLVRCWADSIAEDHYRGAERVFAWSFYSQGTKERVTSADEFIAESLKWFGDETVGQGLSPWDRGHRLAKLIQGQRTLLLLDGLEPLQSGQAFDRGKLKDPGLEVLLFELAKCNPGLCVITTREPVADLADDEIKAAVCQFDLDLISSIASRALLRVSGIAGADDELEAAARAFGNHAFAIKLLGRYLGYWPDRHISHSATVPDLDSPIEQGRHPRRVMDGFARRLGDGPKANLLALLGLFDRPADAAVIAALRAVPAIPGLTKHLVGLSPAAWEEEIADLRRLGLLAPASHHAPGNLDAHPLVRGHFGGRLKAEHPDAWRAGHGRLYEHLRNSSKRLPDTLAEMAPLYQAMHHGCQAGRHREALSAIFIARIQRRDHYYSAKKLAAFGADLAALADVFDHPWSTPVRSLNADSQGFILSTVAFDLRALGRLREAMTPMRQVLQRRVAQADWMNAAINAYNLSELYLVLGDIGEAVAAGEAAVAHADQSGVARWRVTSRAALAHALHQAGERARAKELFEEAEALQPMHRPEYPRFYSVPGFSYCELLLAELRAGEVRERADYSLALAEVWLGEGMSVVDVGLSRLSLGRALLALRDSAEAEAQIEQAVDDLRHAGAQEFLVEGLLARVAFFRETGDHAAARRDLDEVMRIAKRSEMRLFQCDAHLEYARLALAEGDKDQACEHVAEARRLVDETGYGRRRPEVEVLEALTALAD